MRTSRKAVTGVARLRGLLPALTLPALSACASFMSPPSVKIVGVELASMGLETGTAEVTLEVTNERSRSVNVRGFLYDLEIQGAGAEAEWVRLADGFHAEGLTLAGGQVQEVVIPVTFEYRTLGTAVRSFLSRGEVPYRISGEVWVGSESFGLQIPFRSEGVLRP